MRRREVSSGDCAVLRRAGSGGGVPDGLETLDMDRLETLECTLPREACRGVAMLLGRGGGSGGGGWCRGLSTGLTTVDKDSLDVVDAVSTLSDDADFSCSIP